MMSKQYGEGLPALSFYFIKIIIDFIYIRYKIIAIERFIFLAININKNKVCLMTLRVNLDALIKEKELAEARKIPLTDVAAETGLSYLTLQKLRKPGPNGCQLSTIEALCRYFGKPINEVVVDAQG